MTSTRGISRRSGNGRSASKIQVSNPEREEQHPAENKEQDEGAHPCRGYLGLLVLFQPLADGRPEEIVREQVEPYPYQDAGRVVRNLPTDARPCVGSRQDDLAAS